MVGTKKGETMKFQRQHVLLKDVPVGIVCISELDSDNEVTNPTRYLVVSHHGTKTDVMRVDSNTAKSEDVELISTFRVCPESDTPDPEKPITDYQITYGVCVYGYQIHIARGGTNYSDWRFGNKGKHSHTTAKPNGVTSKVEDMLLWAKEWSKWIAKENGVPEDSITYDFAIAEAIRQKWNHKFNLEY